MANKPEVGALAPDFSLEGSDGKVYTRDSFKGKKLVLYFYPKDNTPGCTTEALEFTALAEEFAGKNTVIVGVSPDSVKSHLNFIEKQKLGVLLLSDPDKKAAEAFGAYGEKKNYGKVYMGIIRSTFVLDESGKFAQVMINVKAKGHAEKVLCGLK